MSKVYNSALQERVRQFIKEKGISQAAFADMVGTSDALLSRYLSSKYEGSVENTESKLTEFFRVQDERSANTEKQ